MEKSYLELIKQDQEQNRERATNLPILNQEAKTNIVEASKYLGYFSNPITAPFMKKYILSPIEFPTTLAKLAQSITELNVRVENLHSDAYMYKKAQLEAEEFEIKALEAEAALSAASGELEKRKACVELKKAQLEASNKKVSLNKIELQAMNRYKEAMGWKQCVEDFLKEGGYKSLDDVPWDEIRMEEMAAKTRKWGELAARNQLEMTPSKFNVIDSDMENFNSGFINGLKSLPDGEKKLAQLLGASS